MKNIKNILLLIMIST